LSVISLLRAISRQIRELFSGINVRIGGPFFGVLLVSVERLAKCP